MQQRQSPAAALVSISQSGLVLWCHDAQTLAFNPRPTGALTAQAPSDASFGVTFSSSHLYDYWLDAPYEYNRMLSTATTQYYWGELISRRCAFDWLDVQFFRCTKEAYWLLQNALSTLDSLRTQLCHRGEQVSSKCARRKWFSFTNETSVRKSCNSITQYPILSALAEGIHLLY